MAIKKPTKAEAAAAAVAKMRQASMAYMQPEPAAEIVKMPVDMLRTAPQVRTEFDEVSIAELAADIAERGVIAPLIVRRLDDGYVIVAGERRYRAAKVAGIEAVPAIITDLDDSTASAVQIAENIQREDLSTADTARAVRALYEMHGRSVTDTATKLHKSKAWVSKHLAASCPELRSFARQLLEGGYTEDLEIVLAVDKLQALDAYEAYQITQKVEQGKAGRKSVLDALAQAKKRNDEQKAEAEARRDPSKAEEARKAAEERQRNAHEQLQLEEERLARDPRNICGIVCENFFYIPEDREKISDEQKQNMTRHLEGLYSDGRNADWETALHRIVKISHDPMYECTPLETAAYMLGIMSITIAIDELTAQVEKIVSG